MLSSMKATLTGKIKLNGTALSRLRTIMTDPPELLPIYFLAGCPFHDSPRYRHRCVLHLQQQAKTYAAPRASDIMRPNCDAFRQSDD